jgi:[ribosomal protein S5]-alanine N-acetyltransferase
MQQSAYFLCSRRLGFACWRPEDINLARLLWGDPQVTRLIRRAAFTPAEIEERLLKEMELQRSERIQYWPIFELAGGEFVGCCGLHPYRPPEKICELGFHLRTCFWGRGYAGESGAAAIKYGFETLGLPAIFAGHHPENLASRHVLLKLGFVETLAELYEATGLLHPGYILKRTAKTESAAP